MSTLICSAVLVSWRAGNEVATGRSDSKSARRLDSSNTIEDDPEDGRRVRSGLCSPADDAAGC